MLCSIFELEQLAAAIQQIFERQAEDAPPGHFTGVIPSSAAIRGALRACQEQTTTFDWRLLFLAVENTLDIHIKAGESGAREPQHSSIPESVLRGLTTMLPLVQNLPEDRMIYIRLYYLEGITLIIVWAHYVLELNVVYYNHKQRVSGEPLKKTFGTGEAQVVIEFGSLDSASQAITLMSVTENGKETLFQLKPDTDEMRIGILRREPLCEYGPALIKSVAAGDFRDVEGVVEEMAHVVGAFALDIEGRLFKQPMSSINGNESDKGTTLNQYDGMEYDDESPEEESQATDGDSSEFEDDPEQHQHQHRNYTRQKYSTSLVDLVIPKPTILDRTYTVFRNIRINDKAVRHYANLYASTALNGELPLPNRVLALYKRSIRKDEPSTKEMKLLHNVWRRLVEVGRHLAVLVLALSHVENLGSCDHIPLICQPEALQDHPLTIELRTWNGTDSLLVGEYTWYHALALLLLGHALPTTLGKSPPSLVSSYGWSIYVGTFLQPESQIFLDMVDPSQVGSGNFGITIGVPWRNEVYRRAIFDGLDKGTLTNWERVENEGDTVSLRCAERIRQSRPLYGEREDSFVVTLRLLWDDNLTRRTGYAELFSALWLAQRTESCDHDIATAVLDPNCTTVRGFGDEDHGFDERLVICLTAKNPVARWRALIAISRSRKYKKRHVMLRGRNCCFRCTIEQASAKGGDWYILL